MASFKPPTTLSSEVSPTGYEVPIWTFDQLDQCDFKVLQQRALDLKSLVAKCTWVDPAIAKTFRDTLRIHSEAILIIKWCLEVQSIIFQGKFTILDMGFPPSEYARLEQEKTPLVYNGQRPSIKKPKEAIFANTGPVGQMEQKGPDVHDVPLLRPPSASRTRQHTMFD